MLNILLLLPIIGVIIIVLWPKSVTSATYRLLSLLFAGAILLQTLAVATSFDPQVADLQLREYFAWIDWLGLNYHLAVDGLSLPLIFLNALLTLIAIFASPQELKRPKLYYSMIFLLNAGVTGAFLAQDLLLFFLFYELEIVPLYFLIAIWGGKRRGYAAMKFLLYTAASSFLVLISFLGLVWLSGAESFAYAEVRRHTLPENIQLWLLIPLLIGLAIKIPIFPFHTWLPDAHVEASTPVSVLLAGVLLKLGTYGLLRFGIGLFLDAWVDIAPWLAIIAAISALYGASCAIAQTDMKKVVAYSSIAHMSYVLLAAAATTPLSLNGAIFQMVSHGLISALLFMLVGVVYEATGSREVQILCGLLNPQKGLPLTGSLMILGVMASAGIPGMVGFIAEFLVFRSSFPIFPLPTILCMVGTGLTAVYFLLVINQVFFGRLSDSLAQLPKIPLVNHLPNLVLILLIFVLGIQPNWMVYWTQVQVNTLINPALANSARILDPP